MGSFTVEFPTGVMESLWSGEGLIWESWCYARGWLMIAVLTGDMHGTSFTCYYNLVPHIMGIHLL